MSFGTMIKELRIARKQTLRQFCLDHGHDPSNWSKVERNVNPPPKDVKTLERWAHQLGLKPNTVEWQNFMDQAAVARGEIPRDLLADEKIIEKLPLFFRTVRGAEVGEKEMESLIRKIREAHQPDHD